MNHRIRSIAIASFMVVFATSLLALDDPFTGTWKLNLGGSKYQSTPPITNSFQFEPTGDQGWMKVTVKTVDAEGKLNTHDRVETYDGKPHKVVNDPGAEMVAVERVDPHTIKGTNWKKGKIVTRFTRVVSSDGKTMTTTVDGTNPQGKPFHDVRVFEKP